MCPGAFERFLIARGERVVRVAPKLMAGARRAARERGKSDAIDALAVARAGAARGRRDAPRRAAGRARARYAAAGRSPRASGPPARRDQQPLRWHLHDLWPELVLPGGALSTRSWGRRSPAASRAPSRRCGCGSRATSCGRIRELRRPIRALEAEIAEPRRRGRAAAARRARLRAADRSQADRRDRRRRAASPATPSSRAPPASAPIPAQLGQHQPPPPRPRRQPPAQLRAAPPRGHQGPLGPRHRRLPRPQDRPKARPRKEALRCLKRHLARRVWHLLRTPPTTATTSDIRQQPSPMLLDIDGMCRRGLSWRTCRDLLSSSAELVRAGVCSPWSLRRPRVTIVMGLDQHRAQITAEWIDTSTGEVSRTRIAPADRDRACGGSLSASAASSSRSRWRRRRAGGSWSRSFTRSARRCIWPSRRRRRRGAGPRSAPRAIAPTPGICASW